MPSLPDCTEIVTLEDGTQQTRLRPGYYAVEETHLVGGVPTIVTVIKVCP